MCGLSGTFSVSGKLDRSIPVLMHDKLVHRGPDETYSLNTEVLSAKLGRLGMCGLLDGWQPAADQTGRYLAMTNGEIYNSETLFVELGLESRKNGVDVAVIPELFARYGADGLRKVDGQFATMVYDKAKNEMYLGRDRFGICPLFYTVENGHVHFCSELKPLVHSIKRVWHLDYASVEQYFALGNIVAPRTLVEDVKAVEPGCMVKFGETESELVRYWRYGDFDDTAGRVPDAELRNGLRQSVTARLKSDVEIGAYLSGGFDSTAILMEAAQLSDRPVRSFSVVFDDPTLNEAHFQSEVAKVANSEHTSVLCSPQDIAARFDTMVRHCCFPQRETYNVAAMMLSERVSQAGIKGVVSGEGADELFFGYDSYAFDSVKQTHRAHFEENEIAWGRADFGWETDFQKVNARRQHYLSQSAREQIRGKEFWRTRLLPFSDAEVNRLSPMQMRSVADVYVQLAGHLLGDHGDSMVMANSVEGRYPFLGNDLVALALRTPDAAKVVDFEGKACLKSAYSGIVPDAVINRAKQGFTAYDLQAITDETTWQTWRDLSASTGLFTENCLAPTDGQSYQDKWDFRLGAVSLAIVVDELGLRT